MDRRRQNKFPTLRLDMRYARNDNSLGCHCEERSDEAIPVRRGDCFASLAMTMWGWKLLSPRFAPPRSARGRRNMRFARHGKLR